MLVRDTDAESPTSNGGSEDFTALLEQELDACSLPGSPRQSEIVEPLERDPRKTSR
jgi:hypothetical protein